MPDEEKPKIEGNGPETSSATPSADPKPPVAKPEWQTALDAMQAKLDAQDAELRRLKTAAPATPVAKPPKAEEVDYEEMLFSNPNEAVKRIKDDLRREISGELTRSYQKDQSEKTFWTEFYKENADLKDDDDLVKAILSKNMADLGDLPVKKASERLAELTRDRIGRYTNKTKGSGRAVAEGSTNGTRTAKTEEPPKPTTLSDIIKARRAKRLSKATAA